MTGSAEDGPEWQKHIGNKKQRRELANQFKDARDPFKIVIVRDIYRSGLEFFFKRKPELEMSGCSKPFYSGDCFVKNKTG